MYSLRNFESKTVPAGKLTYTILKWKKSPGCTMLPAPNKGTNVETTTMIYITN